MVEICVAVKNNGKCCTYKAKNGEYCGIHSKTSDCPDCPICLVGISKSKSSSCQFCKYEFHKKCLDRALVNNPTCPCCRASLRETRAMKISRIAIASAVPIPYLELFLTTRYIQILMDEHLL